MLKQLLQKKRNLFLIIVITIVSFRLICLTLKPNVSQSYHDKTNSKCILKPDSCDTETVQNQEHSASFSDKHSEALSKAYSSVSKLCQSSPNQKIAKLIANFDGIKNATVIVDSLNDEDLDTKFSAQSASILLTLIPGDKIHPNTINAICLLIESSFPSIAPENIYICDTSGIIYKKKGEIAVGLSNTELESILYEKTSLLISEQYPTLDFALHISYNHSNQDHILIALTVLNKFKITKQIIKNLNQSLHQTTQNFGIFKKPSIKIYLESVSLFSKNNILYLFIVLSSFSFILFLGCLFWFKKNFCSFSEIYTAIQSINFEKEITKEQIQFLALLLSHLPPGKAVKIINSLPNQIGSKVIACLSALIKQEML